MIDILLILTYFRTTIDVIWLFSHIHGDDTFYIYTREYNKKVIDVPLEGIEYEIKEVRLLFVIGILLHFLRLTYYLQLFDQFAPLIDIIMHIFKDIYWFVIILIMFAFCFASCFDIIAQNQINFDRIEELKVANIEVIGVIPYATLPSAMMHVWTMVLGDTDTAAFWLGDQS